MKPTRFLLPLALPFLLLACSPHARAQSPAPADKAYQGKHLEVRMRATFRETHSFVAQR
jgi:hypothetical protein